MGCSGCNSSFKYLEGDKEMIVAAILCLAIALYCYAITQLQQHGQLRWGKSEYDFGFWGRASHPRKYKIGTNKILPAPSNWYYKLIGSKYKERWLTSTWLTVALTDGYHFMQFMFFNFLSLSFALAIGFNWWLFLGIFIGVRIVHWSARKILSK